MDWQAKKHLARKQEEFASAENTTNKKLKRSYINSRTKRQMIDYEPWSTNWEAIRTTCQRIATHSEGSVSPSSIEKRLNRGEKVTTKYGAVYSLVPLYSNH